MKTTIPARAKIVIANWKMNPTTSADAKRLVTALSKKCPRPKCVVVIAPSFVHLTGIKSVLKKPYLLGTQDAHPSDNGPYTGSVSARMLFAEGVRYCIVGHSERRKAGETDADVHEKTRALLALGMTPIICVGETARDSHGKFYSVVENQLRTALVGVKKSEVERIVVAYEPVWAISSGDGKGQTATPEHAHEMKLYIHKVLVDLYGRGVAGKVRIVYGGSVNEGNAEELMKNAEVDGFLVGGASLKTDAFASIIKIVQCA